MMTLGIICAFCAMMAWGFGDYFIQRSTRSLGNGETIFLIALVGVGILAPFSLHKTLDIFRSGSATLSLLSIASAVLLFAALLEFEALRQGKLSVVEPIWSTEIIASAVLAYIFLGESLSTLEVGVIVLLVVGLFLVSIKRLGVFRQSLIEKASLLALISALVMGAANFLFGVSARATDPFVTNFVTSLFLVVCSGVYLAWKGKLRALWAGLCARPFEILGMTLLDNTAWIAFAFAMTLAPIGITVALSESYIIIAVLLGILINKEKLMRHQKLGLLVSVGAAIVLAVIAI